MTLAPIVVTANGKHYLCVHDGADTISIYEVRASGNITYIDDWAPLIEFDSAEIFRSWCENAVKNNPTPFR
jgi:hypothetical protein